MEWTIDWTNEVALNFIKLYKNEEVLWNPKHSQNKVRHQLSNAWERIQSAMLAEYGLDVSISELKRKKESLLTSYRLNRSRKIDQLRQGNDFHPRWFGFDALDEILGDYDNIPIYEITAEEHNYNIQSTPQTKMKSSRKRLANSDELGSLQKALSNHQIDEDECELYGQLIGKKLKRLTEEQRAIAMNNIDNFMFRAKLNSLRETDRASVFIVANNTKQSPRSCSENEDNSVEYLCNDDSMAIGEE